MKLSLEQSQALLERFGCHVTEACDKCSRLPGPVRYTRKDEARERCSRECRGDERRAIRRGGRPRKCRTFKEQRAAKTRRQQGYRFRPGVKKNPRSLREIKHLQKKWCAQGDENFLGDFVAALPQIDLSCGLTRSQTREL